MVVKKNVVAKDAAAIQKMSNKKTYFGLPAAAWIGVAVVVFAQIALRLWFFQDHIFFHAEQVRDFFVVRDAWQQHHWITLGPIQADTNGVHLGPGYYYILLFFALPFGFSPIAGPVMATVLFLAAWVLVFWFVATRYSLTLATIFGALLMLSENYFLYSSYALNMNIVFLFEALLIIGLMEYVRVQSHTWLALAGVGFIVLLHLHLSAYVLAPIVLLWFVYHRKTLLSDTQLWKPFVVIVGFFIVSYLPFIISEFQNGFKEIGNLFNFVFVQQELSNPVNTAAARAASRGVDFYPLIWLQTFGVWLYASTFSHYYYQLFTALPYIKEVIAAVAGGIVIAAGAWGVARRRFVLTTLRAWEESSYGSFSFVTAFVLLLITLAAKVHSTSVRHYIMIFFVPLLVLAIIATKFWVSKKIWKRGFVGIAFVCFVVLNAWNATVDAKIQHQFPINEPYEGFSSSYRDQKILAQQIAATIEAEREQYPDVTYEVRAVKERKGLRDVMLYLTQLEVAYPERLIAACHKDEKTCAKNTAGKRVIFIDTGAILSFTTPAVQHAKYKVYIFDQKERKTFEKQREAERQIDL